MNMFCFFLFYFFFYTFELCYVISIFTLTIHLCNFFFIFSDPFTPNIIIYNSKHHLPSTPPPHQTFVF